MINLKSDLVNMPTDEMWEAMRNTTPGWVIDRDDPTINRLEAMAADMSVPFLGRIPIDPEIVRTGDAGTPYVHAYPVSESAKAFRSAVEPLLSRLSTTAA